MTVHRPALGLIGAGRAGSALGLALAAAGYAVTAVHSRTTQHARALAERVGAYVCSSAAEAAARSELLLIAVPDDAVRTVAAEVAAGGGFRAGAGAAHISGSLPLDVLAPAAVRGAATGVFHPLQALTGAEAAPLLAGSYVGIEADEGLLPVLREMALALGAHPLLLHGDRVPYHIAAVLASSFPLALMAAAAELMESVGLSREEGLAALLPLARGSLTNLERVGPGAGLTGPVVRGDVTTISRHLTYLDAVRPELASLYRRVAALTLELSRNGTGREDMARLLEEARA